MRKRIVFFAPHLLSPSIASGGDVLFCELGARIGRSRPDWEVLAVGPDFAKPELERYFERVVALQTGRGEGSQGSPLGVASVWARRLRPATRVLTALGADLVHSAGDFFIDVWPVVWSRRGAVLQWSGAVYHINAPPFRRRNDLSAAAASYLLQRASLRALRSADSVCVLNTGVRDELARQRFRLDRVAVVGAGIDTSRFPLMPVPHGARRVVWLNRLEPTKGLFDLPEIVRRLPADVAVDVVGRGPHVHVSRLSRALESAGVKERCVLHGFLEENELREVLAAAGAFISCSYEEGWGISIAEALACGLPCVAYDLPSHREVFGEAIQRVPLGDVARFASAVSQALTFDTDDRRCVRRRIAERYSLDDCAARQEAVFDALLRAG